jgi:biopolymer transport protein ExbD
MPKIKIPRKSTTIDMTAMCDVAFLLLTFFILTTKFRPQETVQIDIPASTAQVPLPDSDIMTFQIAPDGRIFFGLDDQHTRMALLDKLSSNYQLAFSQEERDAFRTLEFWGMDIRSLPDFLQLPDTERARVQQPGLTIDTTGGQHQVEDLILFSRQANTRLRIAIKADKTTEYRNFDTLIKALQNRKVNKFNLITSARSAQE